MKYQSACGGEIPNRGEFDIHWRAEDEVSRMVTFPNAGVGMPIFAMSNVARDKNQVVFEDDGGYALHTPTGKRYDFIIAQGVLHKTEGA